MTESAVAAWTRRRTAGLMGGLLAALLGLAEHDPATAKPRKKKKRKNKRVRFCRQEAQFCREDYTDFCLSTFIGAEAENCLTYYTGCCDLYAACQIGAAEDCEFDGP